MQVNKSEYSNASHRVCDSFLGRFLQGVLSIFDFGYTTRKFIEKPLRDPKLDADSLEADWRRVGSHINDSMKSHLNHIKTKKINDDLARRIALWRVAEEYRKREIEQQPTGGQPSPRKREIGGRPPSRIYAKARNC